MNKYDDEIERLQKLVRMKELEYKMKMDFVKSPTGIALTVGCIAFIIFYFCLAMYR